MLISSPVSSSNRLTRLVHNVGALPIPQGLKQRLLTWAIGFSVPYLHTSAIDLEQVDGQRATLTLRNRRKVQNHIKTVHASAMFLLAEAATGCVLMANLPDGSRFVTTHIEIDYLRKAEGDLRAVAELNADQRELLLREEKGRLTVPVRLTDESGNQPASFSIEWSWRRAPLRRAG